MPIPGSSPLAFSERSIAELGEDDFSPVLKPLYAYRKKMLAIEGLAHTSVLADVVSTNLHGGDANNHSLAVAGLLTGSIAQQRSGFPATGGATSIDQVLAFRGAGAGRFSSRVYGADYVPNSTVNAFSFLGPSEASPMVKDPVTAFNDLLGTTGTKTGRAAQLDSLRTSVLDSVGDEYRSLAPKLSSEGKLKLEQHHALIRDLEMNLSAKPQCTLTMAGVNNQVDQFMRLVRMAFACDLTRVATYCAPVPQCPEFGYPAEANVHASYAHSSISGMTSCGQSYAPFSERAMIDLGVWYAKHLAALLRELDATPEGNGTLLDNTVVVWLTELALPTHQHNDAPVVLFGGLQGAFHTGRYIRYPQTLVSPVRDMPLLGPAHNRLYVSLLQAFGYGDTSFGLAQTTSFGGRPLSLSGTLAEL